MAKHAQTERASEPASERARKDEEEEELAAHNNSIRCPTWKGNDSEYPGAYLSIEGLSWQVIIQRRDEIAAMDLGRRESEPRTRSEPEKTRPAYNTTL